MPEPIWTLSMLLNDLPKFERAPPPRTLNAEPKVKQSNTLMLVLTFDLLPRLELNTLAPLPTRAKHLTDMVLPKLAKPNAERPLPNRMALRTLIELPISTWFTAEHLRMLPMCRTAPSTLKLLPTLQAALQLIDEPKLTNSITLSPSRPAALLSPLDMKLLRDIDDPNAMFFMTEDCPPCLIAHRTERLLPKTTCLMTLRAEPKRPMLRTL